jgi:hypothetical protein
MWHVGEAVSLTFATPCHTVWFMATDELNYLWELGVKLWSSQATQLMGMACLRESIGCDNRKLVSLTSKILISFQITIIVNSQVVD